METDVSSPDRVFACVGQSGVGDKECREISSFRAVAEKLSGFCMSDDVKQMRQMMAAFSGWRVSRSVLGAQLSH